MKEYVIWGKSPKSNEETLLVSEKAGLKSMSHAKQTVELLEGKHNCTECRVQVIDLSQPLVWNAGAMVNL